MEQEEKWASVKEIGKEVPEDTFGWDGNILYLFFIFKWN